MKTYNRICKQCGKSFIAKNSRAIFCSNACKSKEFKKKNRKEYPHKCLYCEKNFISFEKKTKFCSFSCAGKHRALFGSNEYGYCKQCNKKFKKKHSKNVFCSNKCKSLYNSKNQPKVKKKCSFCEIEILVPRKKINKQKNFFCSRKCESSYRENISNEIRICEWCNTEFTCKKHDKLRFCSMGCQSEWQKTRGGKDHPTYKSEITDEMRIKPCEYCGKEMVGTPKSFEKQKYCSYSCKVKSTPKTMSFPHRETLRVLRELEIESASEIQIGRYSADISISNTNLIIEVMGTFWHCDNRVYDKCVNEIQDRSIVRDRKKKTKILLDGYIPLYVWEKDITERYDVCKNLIHFFIENNGKINNYHCINYLLKNGKLKLSNKILIPLFEK